MLLKPVTTNDFVSRSPATQKILDLARRVAASDTSLLLLGETGCGKDYVARAVHGESARAGEPYVAVNCGGMPENLLESELFGYEKGAFTDAKRAKRGFFELAHRGTIFLDEIGEMPPHLQVRLLRVLHDHRIQRLGGEEEIEVDVRVIAATNRDLMAAIEAGEFRRDLYYRLAVVTLTVPALRERREDIPELVAFYLERCAAKLGRRIAGVDPAAMAALEAYGWPGNVRELINVVERAVLLCEDERIGLADLPAEIVAPAAAPASDGHERFEPWLDQPLEIARRGVVEAFERRYLERLLARNGGSVGRTARAAGVDPRTLYNKMRRLGLRKESFKERGR